MDAPKTSLAPEVRVLIPTLASLPMAVMITDTDAVVRWANASLSELTGYSVEAVVGRDVGMLATDTAHQLDGIVQHVIASGESWKGGSVGKRKDGELFKIDQTITPIRDAIGRTTHLLWTKHGKAHPCLFKQSTEGEPLSEVFSAMAEGVVFQRADGAIGACNESAERILGLTADQMAGRTSIDPCWAAVHEDGSPFAGETHPAMVTLRTGEPLSNVVMGINKPDGSLTWISINSRPLVREGEKPYAVVTTFADITDRKRLEAEMAPLQSLFECMGQGAAFCTMLFDGTEPRDFICDTVNSSFARLTGLRDVAGKRVSQVIPGIRESNPELFQICGSVAKGGAPQAFDAYLPSMKIWLSVAVCSPSAGQFIAVFDDITERKRVQDALRKSEEQFVRVFQFSPVPISICDLANEGRFVGVNEAFQDASGFVREELIGRTASEMGFWVDPQEKAESEREFRETGRLRQFEHGFRRKNGEIGADVTSVEVIEFGGTTCALSASVDVTKAKRLETERKLAEETLREQYRRYQILFDRAIDGIFLLSPDAKLKSVNASCARMHGYSVDEMLGMSVNDLDPDSAQQIPRLMGRLLDGEALTFEVEHYHKDGHLFPLEVSASLIDIGGATFIQCFHRDITERKLAEAERNNLTSQLIEAQKMESVGRLAGGVAHEFNNLLTVINGYSSFLLKELSVADPLHVYAEEISTAGERAADLTKQLLAFGRKQIFAPKTLEVNAVVRAFAAMVQRLIGEHIVVVTRLDASLGEVTADPNQLQQVVMNLVLNARDAMPNGGKLELATTNVELDEFDVASIDANATPGRYVLLTITDTGHGMDEATRLRVFDPFFTTKGVGEGTGLGLATVYGIIRQSGGWITVQSKVGVGTSFKIYLPRIDAAPPAVRVRNEVGA